jgi:hypothetical protein
LASNELNAQSLAEWIRWNVEVESVK